MKKKKLSLLLSSVLILNLAIPAVMARQPNFNRFRDLNPRKKILIALALIKGFNFLKGHRQLNDDHNNDNDADWASYASQNYGYSIKYPKTSSIAPWANDNPLCIVSEDEKFIMSIFVSDFPAIYAPEYEGFITVDEELRKKLVTSQINGILFTGDYYFHYIEENKNMGGVSAYAEHNGKYFILTAHHLYENETPLSEEEVAKRLEELKNEEFIKTYWKMAGTLEFTD
ncbi:MAG: hypothetical protein V1860_04235 [bacterium]